MYNRINYQQIIINLLLHYYLYQIIHTSYLPTSITMFHLINFSLLHKIVRNLMLVFLLSEIHLLIPISMMSISINLSILELFHIHLSIHELYDEMKHPISYVHTTTTMTIYRLNLLANIV